MNFLCLVSLHHQPSCDRDDIRAPSNEVEPSPETFSGVLSDIHDVYETKTCETSTELVCRESYCVPYLDEEDGNSRKR